MSLKTNEKFYEILKVIISINIILFLSRGSYAYFPTEILYILTLAYFILIIYKDGIKQYLKIIYIFPLIGTMLLLILYKFSGQFSLLMISVEVLMYLLLYNIFINLKTSEKYFKMILIILITEIVLTCIHTNFIYFTVPNISRTLASKSILDLINYSQFDGFVHYLVGGYGFSYALPMLALTSLHLSIRKNKLYIVLFLLFFITIIRAKYLIALVGFIFSTLIYIMFILKEYFDFKKIIIFGFSILLVILSLLVINYNYEFLYNIYIERVNGIFDFILNKDVVSSNDVYLRLEVYKNSLIGIVDTPFIINFNNVILGGHSTILDLIAVLGIFSITIFYFLFNSLKNVYMYIDDNDKYLYLSLIIYLVFVLLFNPTLVFEIAIAMYIIIPLMVKVSNFNDN